MAFSEGANMEVELIRQKKFGKTFSISTIVAYLILLIYSGLNLGNKALSDMILGWLQPLTFIVTVIVLCNEDAISFKDALSLNKFKPKYLLIAFLAFLSLFFGFGYINAVLGETMAKAGVIALSEIELVDFSDYVLYVIGTALAPALGEEVLFRGILLYGLHRYCVQDGDKTDGRSDLKISLVIGLCFAVFHKNPAQLIYQFACGVTFSLITLKSGSIFPAIIMHFLNNFTILTLMYFAPTFNPLGIVQTIIGLVAFIVVFILLVKEGNFKDDKCKVFTTKGFFKSAWYGLAFCGVIMVVNIISTLLNTYFF